MNTENKDSSLKCFLGVFTTIGLYVISFLGTGEFYLFDRGTMQTAIPYFAVAAVIIMAVYGAAVGYYCKTNGEKNLFLSIYITLIFPYVTYGIGMLLMLLEIGDVITSFLFMPFLLVSGVIFSLCEIGMEAGNLAMVLGIAAFPVATLVIPPVVYKVTD